MGPSLAMRQQTPFLAPRSVGDKSGRSRYVKELNHTLQALIPRKDDLLLDPRSRRDLKARCDMEIAARSMSREQVVIS